MNLIGIGASAGGLEAISQFIRPLNPEQPFAYVILQHLSPNHRSMMVDILSRETDLEVAELSDKTRPRQGVIYVVPSNHNATIKKGILYLKEAEPEVVPKPSINEFFISLAADAQDQAIGVILSGTGSDGTVGLRTIQAAGGITMVQAPDSAKYDGMPNSAIDSGVADYVAPPEKLAQRVSELEDLIGSGTESLPEEPLRDLLRLLHKSRNIDFSSYKTGTLSRRIHRRVVATGSRTLENYVRHVEKHPDELDSLTRDILISITAFFRDRPAFEALRPHLKRLCEEKPDGEEIRVWVAGCATGEEAYSLAILFSEVQREAGLAQPVQIFATDIDDDALNTGRRGVYPLAALSELPKDYLFRYFRELKNGYEATKAIRDMIVFARHNLVDDPPFVRQDLITCRNVLIYFDANLQQKVLQRFHFSLNPDGLLFLGRSESITHGEQLFTARNRKERVFRRQNETAAVLPASAPKPRERNRKPKQEPWQDALDVLVTHYESAAALCDRRGNVRYTAGMVREFFHFPKGQTRIAVSDLVDETLTSELLALQHKFEKEPKALSGRPKQIGEYLVRLHILPVPGPDGPTPLILISPVASLKDHDEQRPRLTELLPESNQDKPDSRDPKDIPANEKMLEDELMATREHLQALVEELATANEEMQSLNEEAQASNEELQATNEEMEAANEELQATNEELVSLNEELNVKTAEVTELNEEYTHLYDSLEFPILVFSPDQQLKRFNAPAAQWFKLRPAALGQPLSRLSLPDYLKKLGDLIGRVIAHSNADETIVRSKERVYQLTVTPGLDADDQVKLIVVTLLDVTEITETEAELHESQSRLRTLMEHTSIALAMKDLNGRYLYANPSFVQAFGLDKDTYQEQSDFDLHPESFAASIWSDDLRALQAGQPQISEHFYPSEPPRIYRTVHQLMHNDEGKPRYLVTEAEDITERKSAENELRIAANVYEQAGEAIIVTDETGHVQTVNQAFTNILGYPEQDALGQPLTRLLQPSPAHHLLDTIERSINNRGFWQGEVTAETQAGDEIPLWLTVNHMESTTTLQHGGRFVVVFSDISNLKETQREAEYLATHDPLTALPNRALFYDRLNWALAHVKRHQEQLALLFIDLDHFKDTNDSLGHDVGDELLKLTADRLNLHLRGVDTVARMGGDEFTVILTETDLEDTERVARRITEVLQGPFTVGENKLFLSASIGIAFAPDDGDEASALVKAADTAMYRAKESGRNRYELFKPELQLKLQRRIKLEQKLRRALQQNLLDLAFQPKFTLTDEPELIGAETLLRWHDEDIGTITPGEFIPVAEATGLINDIDQWVIRQLLAKLAQWQDQELNVVPMAVNISARTFKDENFIDQLLRHLRDYDISHSLLVLEITESTLLSRSSPELGNIEKIRQAGLTLSIDDFGTGYSSLSYLKHLPLSELKIDKSFVDGLGESGSDQAIAEAILAMARALNIRTVAEGVETKPQYEWLQKHNCDIAQGFYFAHPEPGDDFYQRLKKRGKR